MGLLVFWSLAGPHVAATPLVERGVLYALVASFGLTTFWLGEYSHRRVAAVERTYSQHLEQLSDRLRTLAYRDSLTGLYNHRYFYEQLTHELERARRYGEPLAIAMLDMDNFKEINDSCGHIIGDRLLALVGEIIGANVRAADIAARYGGDEFVVILPATDRDKAEAAAAKLTGSIAGGSRPDLTTARLGACFGVSCFPADGNHIMDLLQAADRRLYEAKSLLHGRAAETSLCRV